MKNKKYISIAAIGTLALGLAITAMPAFAETDINSNANIHVGVPAQGWMHGKMGAPGQMRMRPGVLGTVTAVNGTSITISTKARTDQAGAQQAATYTIDASHATVTKNNATGTVSSIAVGDIIAVQGTVTGTSVVATNIRDGIAMRGTQDQNANPIITGNGQPIVAGNVTAVSGNTITITNKSNATYTVDATNAKIQKGNALSSVSNIAVGDMIVVQGTVNNSSITATSVMDQGVRPQDNSSTGTPKAESHGFFGSIGNFFSHLFGF